MYPHCAKPARETTNAEIRRLIATLDSLREGEQAAYKLADCGAGAIGPLRKFLLQGRPSGIYQPRCWAVAALASLGAKDVLIDYLRWEKQIRDPVVRLGEEAVENAAARELAQWRTEDVFQALLEISRKRLLPGLVEALGEFRRAEAVPYLDRALEDDVCRRAAEQALQAIGVAARPALVLSAVTPLPGAGAESPSSLRRRRSVLRILAEGGVPAEDQASLRPLLDDPDPEIVIRTAQVLASHAAGPEGPTIARRLLEVLPSAGWSLHQDVEECLVELGEVARPQIEMEIARRMHLPATKRAFDSALPALLRVSRRMNTAGQPGVAGV
jgi:hypothetical protein